MRIYDRIRSLCKANGITVTGLEKSLGFARGSLSKIDTNRPSFERISKLADSLGVTTNYLMTGEMQALPSTSHSEDEYDMVADILKNRGWNTSNEGNEVVISSGDVSYTVTNSAYKDFCDGMITYIENALDELLHSKTTSVKFTINENGIHASKIMAIAEMLQSDTLQAAHADASATKDQLESDIEQLRKKGDKGDL